MMGIFRKKQNCRLTIPHSTGHILPIFPWNVPRWWEQNSPPSVLRFPKNTTVRISIFFGHVVSRSPKRSHINPIVDVRSWSAGINSDVLPKFPWNVPRWVRNSKPTVLLFPKNTHVRISIYLAISRFRRFSEIIGFWFLGVYFRVELVMVSWKCFELKSLWVFSSFRA